MATRTKKFKKLNHWVTEPEYRFIEQLMDAGGHSSKAETLRAALDTYAVLFGITPPEGFQIKETKGKKKNSEG